MWKILLILSAVFAAGAAYVGYENMQSLKTEKVLRDRAKDNLAAYGEFQKRADALLKELTDMLTDVTDKNDKATQDLAAANEMKTKVESELATVTAAIEEKKAKVAAAQEQMKEWGNAEETMAKITQLEEGIALAKAQAAQLSQQNLSNANANTATKKNISDYRNLELWQKTGKMKSLNATVAMVSDDFRFVIINAGNNRGVVSQAKLDVRRGGSKVGEVRVAVLEPVRSVCNIESLAPGETIRPGDRVVVSQESIPTEADTAEAVAKAKAPPTPVAPTTPATTPAAPAEADPLSTDPLADDPFGGLDGGLDPEMEKKPEGDGGGAPADDPFGL